jgi:hypothetical protein
MALDFLCGVTGSSMTHARCRVAGSVNMAQLRFLRFAR